MCMGSREIKEPRISVVIPVYLRTFDDLTYLKRALTSLAIQEYAPYQVIISIDLCFNYDAMGKLLAEFSKVLKLESFENLTPKGISSNSNNGLRQVRGDLIHVLHQDDALASPSVYHEIAESFLSKGSRLFLLTARRLDRVYRPAFDLTALVGNNRFGGPSGLIFVASEDLSFDPNLTMLCDIDLLYRLSQKFGSPEIVPSISISYGVSENQAQNRIGIQEFEREVRFLLSKTGVKPIRVFFCMLHLRDVSQFFAISQILAMVEEQRHMRLFFRLNHLAFRTMLFVRRATT